MYFIVWNYLRINGPSHMHLKFISSPYWCDIHHWSALGAMDFDSPDGQRKYEQLVKRISEMDAGSNREYGFCEYGLVCLCFLPLNSSTIHDINEIILTHWRMH